MNYIKEHWRGHHSLVRSYWINLFFLGWTINLIYIVAFLPLLEKDDWSQYSIELWLISLILLIIINVWMWVGTWRSANEYIYTSKKSYPKKSSFWGYVAQVFIALGIFSNLGTLTPILRDALALLEEQNSEINNQYLVEFAGDTDLILNGYINEESSKYVINSFKNNNKLTSLILNSPGGYLDAAFDLADYVENNELLVAVNGQCYSACLLILASANETYISPESKLAFHHPEDTVEFTSNELRDLSEAQTEEYYSRFLRYGMPEEKLNIYRKSGWTDLTIGEAYNLNLVKYLWEPDINNFTDLRDVCNKIDCFVTPISIEAEINNTRENLQLKAGELAAALQKWRPLAEQGDASAQYNLGLMYQNGSGVSEDFLHAYMWFNLAAAQGMEDAKAGKKFAEERMTREQIAEAQKLSREWIEKHQ